MGLTTRVVDVDVAALQEKGELVGGHGPADQESLRTETADLAQERELLPGLEALLPSARGKDVHGTAMAHLLLKLSSVDPMPTIQRRITSKGHVRYRSMVRVKGAPVQYATFAKKSDARKWGLSTEVAIRDGRYFQPTPKNYTIADLIDRYRAEVLAKKEPEKRRDQERHLDWWRERLGDYSVANVGPPLITQQRELLASGKTKYGKQRSPATVNRYLTSLSHVFSVAVREWSWATRNPLRSVSKLREPRGRTRFLSEREISRLLTACESSEDSRLLPLVVLAISTGARRGELLSLRWADLDLSRGLAVLRETKNGEIRSVPIVGHASQTLESMRPASEGRQFIFADETGTPTFPREAFQEALRAAQIDDFRFHDLRHTAASYLAMSGATLVEIAAVLGHKTLAMVKRYSHFTEQHTAAVVARMNERVFEAVTKSRPSRHLQKESEIEPDGSKTQPSLRLKLDS